MENDSDSNNDQNRETVNEKLHFQTMERQEYMTKLKKWLDEARLWHCGNSLSNYSSNSENMLQFGFNQTNIFNYQSALLNAYNNYLNTITPSAFIPNNSSRQPPSTFEFVIPPLWKRAVAELMDFLLLFLLKMALTFVILESFDIIDMGFHGFEAFQKNLENSEVAMPIAVELLTLEVLHRIIVCIYETYFLRGKLCATPGKRYMGLIVVSAESIAPGRLPDTVKATRVIPLNWQKSFIRASMKNLFIGVLMPICAAFYIFPYNRTSYDMMSHSIVVEYHHEFMLWYSAV